MEIKAANNKLEQNKAQYNLEKLTSKISALLSAIVSEYGFLTGKDIFYQKNARESCSNQKI